MTFSPPAFPLIDHIDLMLFFFFDTFVNGRCYQSLVHVLPVLNLAGGALYSRGLSKEAPLPSYGLRTSNTVQTPVPFPEWIRYCLPPFYSDIQAFGEAQTRY